MTNKRITSNKKITVGFVLGWVFGIIFGLTGIITITIISNPISGIIMLIMCAVIFPPINKLIDKKFKFHLSSILKIALIFVGFIIFGATLNTPEDIKQQNNQQQIQKEQEQQSLNNKQKVETIKTETVTSPILAEHKVIPNNIKGTTRSIYVIIKSNTTKDQIIIINNSLINKYSEGLTHLKIDYFDNETIAKTYFKKILEASETEAEELFKHYLAIYTMNKTSGLNELSIKNEDYRTTIKEY